ncbi:hypothetical protein P7K49_017074 [Saguinus oedipus]|uniref:60S ribosomal protein L28 n=1 Tax=Saguinus oedipus TaxID=9490 RepID=A0ABQ9V1F9_SAGOE|nr:hypothetical protein P7K49_017074 [Saguinus oedipus]
MVVQNCSFPDQEEQTDLQNRAQGLKARSSFRYNGLIHCKTVGVEPAAYVRTAINKNASAMLSSIKTHDLQEQVTPHLRMAAIRRASTILRSQKPVM